MGNWELCYHRSSRNKPARPEIRQAAGNYRLSLKLKI